MIKIAVIPAGGKGTRVANPDIPKPMIRINNKPILESILSKMNDCGIKEAYLLVHYLKDQIINYFGPSFKGIKINYVDVHEALKYNNPIGLADVIGVMKERINEVFVVVLGDEVYLGSNHKSMIESFEDNCDAMIGVIRVNDKDMIRKNYTLRIDSNLRVIDLEEKPEEPWNDILGCGTYIFKPNIFDFIKKTPLSTKSGRRELTDTLRVIAKDGLLRAFNLGGSYVNINYKEDIKKAEELS